jgi:hypothetical protein
MRVAMWLAASPERPCAPHMWAHALAACGYVPVPPLLCQQHPLITPVSPTYWPPGLFVPGLHRRPVLRARCCPAAQRPLGSFCTCGMQGAGDFWHILYHTAALMLDCCCCIDAPVFAAETAARRHLAVAHAAVRSSCCAAAMALLSTWLGCISCITSDSTAVAPEAAASADCYRMACPPLNLQQMAIQGSCRCAAAAAPLHARICKNDCNAYTPSGGAKRSCAANGGLGS